MKTLIATLALALLFAAAPVMATENPFSMNETAQIQTADAKDGKCGEGMKKAEGKCGEGKCGDAMKKCMETKTKEECKKDGKCGEGKCGDGKKEGKKDAKCGEGMKK
jgi:uncharacterized low-complexity protein